MLGPTAATVVEVGSLVCEVCCIVSVLDLDTSNGTSLAIGLFVLPVAVLILAALTRPSFPLISSSITASFQVVQGVSLCINTTSPTLIRTLFVLLSSLVVLSKRGQILISPLTLEVL